MSVRMRWARRSVAQRASLVVGLVAASVLVAQAQWYHSNSDLFPGMGTSFTLDSPGIEFAPGYELTSMSFFDFTGSLTPSHTNQNDQSVTFDFNLVLNGQIYSGQGVSSLMSLDYTGTNSGIDSYLTSFGPFTLTLGGGAFDQYKLTASGAGTYEVQQSGEGYLLQDNMDFSAELKDQDNNLIGSGNGHDSAGVLPEPFTASLGLAGIGLFIRRRKAKKAAK